MHATSKVILVLVTFVFSGYCFPNGAPSHTCLTMFPKHKGIQAIQTKSPFTITLSRPTYTPGQEINITLEANDGRPFVGIQIRAHRRLGDTETVLGTFIGYPSDKLKTIDCFGVKENMVTHRNNRPVTRIDLSWKSPPFNEGDIVFTATFVEEFETFWVNNEAILKSAMTYTPSYNTQVSAVKVDIDFNECGKSMGCVLYPTYCTGEDCTQGLTFKSDVDHVTFQVFAKAENYVSVGFSHDKDMGDDQTVTCTAAKDRVTIQHGWNHPHLYNVRNYLGRNFSDMATMQRDGKVYCTFTRPKFMTVDDPENPNVTYTYDLSDEYNVMIAKGHTYEGTDVIGYHTILPIITWTKVNFEAYETYRAGSLPIMTKIHATLMLTAWVFLAGLATVVSRYYRKLGKITKGTAVWFQVHRLAGILVSFCVAAAVALIFIKVEGLTKKAALHGWFGVAVTAVLLIQVTSGLLRPGLEDMGRPAFNFGHWLIGKLAQLIAAVTLFLAFNIKFIPETQKRFGFIILGVWVGLQLLWELILECRKRRREDKSKGEKRDRFKEREEEIKTRSTFCDKLLLVIYITVMFLILMAGISSIFLF